MIQNARINLRRELTADADGGFQATGLPAAAGYEILAAYRGARIDSRSGIEIAAGDERLLLPPLLDRGPIQ